MKIFRIMCIALFVAVSAHAESIKDGTYIMNDGSMQMTIKIQNMQDGRMFVDGMGTGANGRICRIGDLATFNNNSLVVGGLCAIPVTLTSDGFQFNETPQCLHCDAGTYVKGTYRGKTP